MPDEPKPGPPPIIDDDVTIYDPDIPRQYDPARTPPPVVAGPHPPPITRQYPFGWVAAIVGVVVIAGVAVSLFVNRGGGAESPIGNEVPPPAIGTTDDETTDLRDRELAKLKQLGIAVMIYAADYDDNLPRPLEDLQLVLPYLKNADMMYSAVDGSMYKVNRKYSGYNMTAIENPAQEPLAFGPVMDDGYRGVVRIDGSAKIVPDDPSFAQLANAEPLIPLSELEVETPGTSSAQAPEETQLKAFAVDNGSIQVPVGWKYTINKTPGLITHRWEAGKNGAFVKLDISPGVNSDLVAEQKKFETRFKTSKRYRYELVRLRTGSEAYNGGVIWNFHIAKDDEPMHKRTIAYWHANGNDYGLVVSCWESVDGYKDVYTQILNSCAGW